LKNNKEIRFWESKKLKLTRRCIFFYFLYTFYITFYLLLIIKIFFVLVFFLFDQFLSSRLIGGQKISFHICSDFPMSCANFAYVLFKKVKTEKSSDPYTIINETRIWPYIMYCEQTLHEIFIYNNSKSIKKKPSQFYKKK
jgi:hypothetical protein